MDSGKPFDLAMMHTAELDHSVHITSLSNQATDKILRRADQLFQGLVDRMDSHTTLIMTADHGLLEKGHGGAATDERKTFLFAYNKQGLLKANPLFQKHFGANIAREEEDQLALTPTLSLLLNISPPFNSLDTILPELLPNMDFESEEQLFNYLLPIYDLVIQQKLQLVSLSSVLSDHRTDLVTKWTQLATKCSALMKGTPKGEQFLEEAMGLIKEVEALVTELKNVQVRLANYSSGRESVPMLLLGVIIALVAFIFSLATEFIGSAPVTFRAGHLIVALVTAAVLHFANPQLPLKFAIFLVFAGLLLIYELITIVKNPKKFSYFMMSIIPDGSISIAISMAVRISENANIMQDKMPFQSLALLYLFVQYPFNTTMHTVLRALRKAPLLRPILSDLLLFAAEAALLLLLSMGDEYFLSNYEHGYLIGPYAVLASQRFLFGTVLPGLVTLVGLAYATLVELRLPERLAILHLCNYVFACVAFYFSEESYFWGRAVAPNILLLTSVGVGYLSLRELRAQSQLGARYEMTKVAFLLLFLLPFFVLIGGHFSAYNILFTVLLLLLRYCTDEGKGCTLSIFVVILTRLSYIASGKRKILEALPLKAGTLFYNDYHSLSWIPVLIRTVYPLALVPLFYLYFQQRTLSKLEVSFRDLKGNNQRARGVRKTKLKLLYSYSTMLLLTDIMIVAQVLATICIFMREQEYQLIDVTNSLLHIVLGFALNLVIKAVYFLNIFK